MLISSRKSKIRAHYNNVANKRALWIEKNKFYYDDEIRYLRFLIQEGLNILEIGCGTGRLLDELKPSYGVGVDISDEMIKIARCNYPELFFICGDIEDNELISTLDTKFDVIIISDTIGCLDDVELMLKNIHALSHTHTRLVVAFYSSLWEPILRLAEYINAKMPIPEQNWLGADDIAELCFLSDWQVVKKEWRQLIPKSIFGLGTVVNRFLGTLPGIRRLCLRDYIVARPLYLGQRKNPSVSIVIPCRNEEGHVEQAVTRIPKLNKNMEIIFVEGNSEDATWAAIQRVQENYQDLNIRSFKQDGKGKKDAVWKGFDNANGELLIILDGDLTVPPETLVKFYEAYVTNKGEFLMGSRMIYPVDKSAMRFLNYWANNIFASIFSWLLNQKITDTLCGTKVILKKDYYKILEDNQYLGKLDPFGDFDLIFGAAKKNLKIQEIPIRYVAREYGETQISRFRHGLMLLKMTIVAYRRFKML